MLTLTAGLLVMSLSAVPAAQEFELKLHEVAKLSDGTTLTFSDYTVEEIAASPENPKAYPGGSGVTFVFKLARGKDSHELLLSDLSEGYTSKRDAHGLGWKVTLVLFSGALTPSARAKIRVERT
jgi:hypothetical protein